MSPWLQLASFFGLFTAGGMIGLWLASWSAPGSGVAAGISGLLLPAAFAGAIAIWSGLEFLHAIVGLIRGRGRHAPRSSSPTTLGPWFLTLSLTMNAAGGLVVGVLPGGRSVAVTFLAYSAAGLVFGWLAATLARRGYLPAPQSF